MSALFSFFFLLCVCMCLQSLFSHHSLFLSLSLPSAAGCKLYFLPLVNRIFGRSKFKKLPRKEKFFNFIVQYLLLFQVVSLDDGTATKLLQIAFNYVTVEERYVCARGI